MDNHIQQSSLQPTVVFIIITERVPRNMCSYRINHAHYPKTSYGWVKKKLATNRMMLDCGNKSWILPLRMKMKEREKKERKKKV